MFVIYFLIVVCVCLCCESFFIFDCLTVLSVFSHNFVPVPVILYSHVLKRWLLELYFTSSF